MPGYVARSHCICDQAEPIDQSSDGDATWRVDDPRVRNTLAMEAEEVGIPCDEDTVLCRSEAQLCLVIG